MSILGLVIFFFNVTATSEISTLALHDALPISFDRLGPDANSRAWLYRIATNAGLNAARRRSHRAARAVDLRSEEHTSELQSLPYLVCRLLLRKKNYKKIIESLRPNSQQ